MNEPLRLVDRRAVGQRDDGADPGGGHEAGTPGCRGQCRAASCAGR